MSLVSLWILLLGLPAEGYALAGERSPPKDIRELYTVRPDDTLSEILFERGIQGTRPGLYLYGREGWVRRNQELNRHIRDWRGIQPDQTLELVLPGDLDPITTDERPSEPVFVSEPIEIHESEKGAPKLSEKRELPRRSLIARSKLTFGGARSSFNEELSAVSTETAGQTSIPVLSGELLLGIVSEKLEPRWLYGVKIGYSKPEALSSLTFSPAWNLSFKVVANHFLQFPRQQHNVSPFLELGTQSFSYVSSEEDGDASQPHYTRFNTSFWSSLGAQIDLSLFGRWTEIEGAIVYSPRGSSTATSRAAQTTSGIGGCLQVRIGFLQSAFLQADLKLFRLLGEGLALNGQIVGFGAGIKF